MRVVLHALPPTASISSSTLDGSPNVRDSIASSNSRASVQSAPGGLADAFDKLDLLLSLDIALELIHADRESLKRAETFSGYPGQYGHRVRDTIEELFVLVLQALGERHIRPGFDKCVAVPVL